MRRVFICVAAAAVLSLTAVSTVGAAAPTCSEEMGIAVHGQHVVRDYVIGDPGMAEWPPSGSVGSAVGGNGAAVPGGPGPGFHFIHGFAPGASFCNGQSNSPGFHFP